MMDTNSFAAKLQTFVGMLHAKDSERRKEREGESDTEAERLKHGRVRVR